jgi:transposase
MRPKYIVTLTADERHHLENLISSGKHSARSITRARILLKTDCGPKGPGEDDEEIVAALDTSLSTVHRVRERFVTESLDAAVNTRSPKRVYERRLDGTQEAQLIALACSAPPEGRGRWTMQLLASRLVELGYVERVSKETVRTTLKKTRSSRGSKSSG